jgi:hypothetical protein
MSDKPIIFSAPMIRALLAGRKTQTRRVLKPQPSFSGGTASGVCGTGHVSVAIYPDRLGGSGGHFCKSPYAFGDRLWVREAGALFHNAVDCTSTYDGTDRWVVAGWQHAADGAIVPAQLYQDHAPPLAEWIGDCSSEKRSPIHMPRWASRLTLTVTDVRVQRLQDISEADAVAEGVDAVSIAAVPRQATWSRRSDFAQLWNSIHGPDAWTANPWVCALTFTVHNCNIDQMGAANAKEAA